MTGPPGSTSTQQGWSLLYRVAGAGALLSAVLIPVQVLVFIIWPPPLDGLAADWFALLHDNQLVGLANLDLLLVADNVLLVPILLALNVLLRRAGESLMALTTTLGLLGVVFSIASNPAFGMLVLSNRYDAATTQAQRSAALAAGEALLASAEGTAFHAYYVLGSVAGILIGVMMLRSTVFSGLAGWMALHVDHAGGLKHFAGRVPVHVQRAELDYGLSNHPEPESHSIYRIDFDDPRIDWRQADGDAEIAPGVTAVLTAGHTPGHQSFIVDLAGGGGFVFAFDAADLTENIEGELPIGGVIGVDPAATVEPIRRLKAIAAERGYRLVPGHDPWAWPLLTDELTGGGRPG